MKNFDSRTYSINDFLEWDRNKQLELNPKFQRRSVWTDTARSFLMDTIVRGLPIPKFFIRQKLNVQTKQSVREVVDGQQRLRTILSFMKDGFQISKRHNEEFGGLYFSQLDQVDPEIQSNILNYELSVDLLVNMPDVEVLDVFSRLNSYAVILNEQEKLNAVSFGPFKTLSDKVAHNFNIFWLDNKILKDAEILRMADVTLVSDLLIAVITGIKGKTQIKTMYSTFEKKFDYDTVELEKRFTITIQTIQKIFGNQMVGSELRRIHLFYSLFTTIYHLLYGIPEIDKPTPGILESSYEKIYARLDKVNSILGTENVQSLEPADLQFLEDTRRATTNTTVRKRRTEFLIDLILA
ncbi:MAG: DUF262 domain-containing protein [Cytophagales bacterium]|jgi:hypothetical protein|nr:DUF262 domain-containing protein [Cytophagales bacterium]MCA6370819.1 DUF262 domain-containing protein [Cytophagales bacterium]MCA6385828.1 DUF262 domain-containing protein [Cytophagales bacterium]